MEGCGAVVWGAGWWCSSDGLKGPHSRLLSPSGPVCLVQRGSSQHCSSQHCSSTLHPCCPPPSLPCPSGQLSEVLNLVPWGGISLQFRHLRLLGMPGLAGLGELVGGSSQGEGGRVLLRSSSMRLPRVLPRGRCVPQLASSCHWPPPTRHGGRQRIRGGHCAAPGGRICQRHRAHCLHLPRVGCRCTAAGHPARRPVPARQR